MSRRPSSSTPGEPPGRSASTVQPGRGHSLVFDSGSQDVADAALQFLKEKVHR
jgi:hypothetical protein